MIKLILEINETENSSLRTIKAVGCDVSIKEILFNATEGEKEISSILKERLQTKKKFQVEGSEKIKKILNKLSEFDI